MKKSLLLLPTLVMVALPAMDQKRPPTPVSWEFGPEHILAPGSDHSWVIPSEELVAALEPAPAPQPEPTAIQSTAELERMVNALVGDYPAASQPVPEAVTEKFEDADAL